MTLDDAIAQARAIQRDLDAGRLPVPYPDDVRAQLVECLNVFTGFPAAEVIARLEAPDLVEMELPW